MNIIFFHANKDEYSDQMQEKTAFSEEKMLICRDFLLFCSIMGG